MAGYPTDASAPRPFPRPSLDASSSNPPPNPFTTTRTRRRHGTFVLAGRMAIVTSSRRQGEALAIGLEIGPDGELLRGLITPAQARSIARALSAAADAVDLQREVQHG
ncbi:MAG: hypothetical protein QM750_23160 [Rubrivivax sp.]